MIKCKGFDVEKYRDDNTKLVLASLAADDKSEVESMGNICSNVIGLNDGDEISFASTCLCTSGDFGMLDSSGSWKF